MLLKEDLYLLVKDVNERSITHRLAVYLEEEFPEWHVDCEYNRNYDDKKQIEPIRESIILKDYKVTTENTQAVTVYPDLIVHHRGTKENLLVIEVKKTSRMSPKKEDYDFKKLKAYKEQFRYKFVVFVEVDTQENEDRINWEFL